MTLASLQVEELMAEMPVQHGGFGGTIHLDNAARLDTSVRVVKLELSHGVRIEARRKAL